MHLRPLTSFDANAEPSALYTLVPIQGEAHTIVIGEPAPGSWEVTIHRGIEDEIADWDPLGVVYAESEADARRIAEALIRSDLALLPYFDAIDTCLDRLDRAYGEDRISALFTVEPTLAIAI